MIFRKEISESLTLKFAEAVNERKKRGEDIISLGLGEPDFDTPVELVEALRSACYKPESSRYSASAGLTGLRQKIAGSLKQKNNINCSAGNILITPGTKQSISLLLMALLEPGDEVVIILPAYVSYVPQVYLAEPQVEIRFVHLDKRNYDLNIEEFEKAITPKTKAVILNSPHNPTGRMIPENLLRKIFEITERYNTYILSDEIYDKLVFGETPHFSIGSIEESVNRVITFNGFGKSLAVTGWRIGYTCFPLQLWDKVIKLQQHINTNTSTVIQMAFDMAWPLPDDHLIGYNRKLASRTAIYRRFLQDNPLLGGSIPQGSFFAFINIGKLGIDSVQFASKLVDKTGVAVTAGIAFGIGWDDHIRISLAVDEAVLSDALVRIQQFIESEQWK